MDDRPVMLVTGSRKGIGKFLSTRYSVQSYYVVGCSRKEPGFESAFYTHLNADISDEDQVHNLIKFIRNKFGRLDVVINNAGIASMNHFLLMPAATATAILNTNLKGTFLVCRESAKLMKKNRFGRIVNFSTVAVPMNLDGEAIYAASKSGVEAFTRIIARELAAFGITCNCIGPTPIETDLIRAVPKEKIDQIVQRLAVKRLGRFEDVAQVIDFFIDPASEYITGQTIYLGGM